MAKVDLSKRGTAVAAALLLAVLGTLSLLGYVRGLERKALAQAEPVGVLIAKEAIPAGTPAETALGRGLVARDSLPRKAVVEGAVTTVEELQGKAALVDILKGEQIVLSRFGAPGGERGLLPIPPDRQAISVEVGTPPGAAGFIQPGDRVSVIAKTAAQGGQPRAQFLLQDVGVLAVGQRVVTEANGTPPSEEPDTSGRVLLTLALTPPEAEKIAFAVTSGELWFTLLPPGQQPSNTHGRTADNLFS